MQCHTEVAGLSCKGINAGHQDNFVQSLELTHRVTVSYATAEYWGIRGNAQAPGQPAGGVFLCSDFLQLNSKGITLSAHFSSRKHHSMELPEGAPPLIWSSGVASGAVSHAVVDMLTLRAHLWFYNRRI